MIRLMTGRGRSTGVGPSKALLAMVLSACVGLGLLVADAAKGWREPDAGVVHTSIGLFSPEQRIRGAFGLNSDVDLSMYLAGLTVDIAQKPVLATVFVGSPVTVLHGAVDQSTGSARERVEGQSEGLAVTEVKGSPAEAVYLGKTLGPEPAGLSLSVTAGQPGVPGSASVSVSSTNGDAVVLHLSPASLAATLVQCLPGRTGTGRSWWVTAPVSEAGCSPGGAALRIEPAGARVAVDLRTAGTVDLHIWSRSATLTLTTPTETPTVGS